MQPAEVILTLGDLMGSETKQSSSLMILYIYCYELQSNYLQQTYLAFQKGNYSA